MDIKKIAVAAFAVVLLGAGCSSAAPLPTPTTTPTPVVDTQKPYTLAQVQAANTPAKCWAVIRGNVYDLTAWITQHPGGDRAILSLCGLDGTAAFERQHNGQMRPEQTLDGFQIGIVK